jgi:uncharacterized protein YggU (UPF0235/DUF167 family)
VFFWIAQVSVSVSVEPKSKKNYTTLPKVDFFDSTVLFSVSVEPKSKKNYITLPKVDIFDAHNFDLDIDVDENQVNLC